MRQWGISFDPERVDAAIEARFAQLHAVVERSALLKHEARVGLTEDVLIDGPSRRDPSVLTGKTEQGKLVHLDAGGQVISPGDLVAVEIERAAPHFLVGRPVGEARGPRRRRLALAGS